MPSTPWDRLWPLENLMCAEWSEYKCEYRELSHRFVPGLGIVPSIQSMTIARTSSRLFRQQVRESFWGQVRSCTPTRCSTVLRTILHKQLDATPKPHFSRCTCTIL